MRGSWTVRVTSSATFGVRTRYQPVISPFALTSPSSSCSHPTAYVLRRRAPDEDVWAVRQIMRLGLWMAHEEPGFGPSVEGLLSRDDVAASTVLLGMLHHDRAAPDGR